MLKNTFRMVVGLLIAVVFGVAVFRFVQQTAGNAYVGGAILSGLKFFLFLGVVLGVVYRLDRRAKRREP